MARILTRYFTRPNPGVLLPRYYVMHPTRNAFVAVQMSCPDGEHIREPAGVADERDRARADVRTRAHGPDRGGQFRIGAHPKAPCTRCKRVLPIAEFGTSSGRADGRSSWCRACHADDSRQRYARKRAAKVFA